MTRPPFPNLWTAALLCLVALPAQAQDFRGLLPGDPATRLAELGEPISIERDATGLRRSVYPLPFQQRLEVRHDGTRLLALRSWSDIFSQPPETGGLQAMTSSLGEVVDLAGSEGWFFETEGQATLFSGSTQFRIYYDLAAHPDTALALIFFSPDVGYDEASPLPGEALMIQAELYHTDYFSRDPDRFGTTRVDRPGAAPLTVALAEVFPLNTP